MNNKCTVWEHNVFWANRSIIGCIFCYSASFNPLSLTSKITACGRKWNWKTYIRIYTSTSEKNNNTLPAVFSAGSKVQINNIRSLLHYRCFSAWPGKTNAERLFAISSVYVIEFPAPSARRRAWAPQQIGDVVIIAVFIRHRPNCDSNTEIIFENSNEALQGLMNK